MTQRRGGVLALALAALSCGRGEEAEPGAAEAAPLAAVTLTPSDVAVARTLELTGGVAISGPLEPAQTVELKTQINGRVRQVHVDRGSRVRRGQVLVELEGEGIGGQTESARAAVASAEADLALAAQRLASSRRLHEAGGISDIDLRSAEAAHNAAQARLAAARAQLVNAAEREAYATIRSPIDGVVSAREVEAGEAVSDGNALLTVVDTRTLELQAQVDVDAAMNVRPGLPVVFSLDALPRESFQGRVARVDPRADPATRQVGIAAQLPNANGRIVAGQFARGRVLTGRPQSVTAIPMSAVTDSAGVSRVFVIVNGRLERRNVSLGIRDEAIGMVAVTQGLAAGDRVLAAPVIGAADGLPVTLAGDSAATRRVAPADSAPGPSPSGQKGGGG
ncbi:MAG TPA: efflux RND transporter periplasmic adaptor subunit [Gemmatimonadaceae bacterium]|nr:efflux RND transporter periplasmic adaptor subunit [Gemmatimonadaceae bacterium]